MAAKQENTVIGRGILRSSLASLFCAAILALGTVPVAHASSSQDAREFFENTDELAGFVDQVGNLNPLADGGLGGTINVFGVQATAYLYSPTPLSKPVLALLLPSISLGSIVPPLSGTPMDVTLDHPVAFITFGDGYLKIEEMPSDVRVGVKSAGFPHEFKVENGFNIFGQVGGRQDDALHQLLSVVNLNSGLLAGYSSPSKKVQVKPDDAKKTKFKYRVLSLVLPADTTWERPLFIKDVSITGASIRMKTPKDIKVDGTTTFQVIGGARIAGTAGYHLFMERSFDKKAPAKSLSMLLAINPNHAVTMGDFLAISRVMGDTLGLRQALPSNLTNLNLPLDQIKLVNPYDAQLAFPDEGAPPDFNKVMFAGAMVGTKIPDRLLPGPLLTANADAEIFGYKASQLKLNFDLTGIKASAGINLPRLEPLNLAGPNLDLAIGLSAAPHARINTGSAMGNLAIAASSSGFSFEIPAKCPLEPLGLKATLNGFDLTKDFSIKPDLKDCISAEIKDLIDDVGGKATQTVGEWAGDVASTAEGLAEGANSELRNLDTKRIAAWTKAVDAIVGPAKAKQEAQKAYDGLKHAIDGLNDSIRSLSDWIDDALRSIWNTIKGELKKKKKERSQKVAERDRLKTEKAAAAQRLLQAAEAEKQAANTPVPSHDPELRALQEQQLSQMAIVAQQGRIAAAAKSLPMQLASTADRKKLLDEYDVASQAAIAEAEWATKNGASLRTYLGGGYKLAVQRPGIPIRASDSPRLPSGEAVLTSLLDKKQQDLTANIMKEEVPNLPTMAYGKRVLIQGIVSGELLCLTILKNSSGSAYADLAKCDGRRPEQRFSFDASGLVRLPDVSLPVLGKDRKYTDVVAPCLRESASHIAISDCSAAKTSNNTLDTAFTYFFDPLDGLIRQPRKVNVPGYSKDACLFRFPNKGLGANGTCVKGNTASTDEPSRTPMTWRLVSIEADGQPAVRATAQQPRHLRAAASNGAAPAIAEGLTNLAPLHLD